MPGFKDYINQDLAVFLSSTEFAESHKINGRMLNIVIDNDRLMQRSKKEFDGISVGELLYYVSAAEYGDPPKVDEIQMFDSRQMQVFDVRVDTGIYEVILRGNG